MADAKGCLSLQRITKVFPNGSGQTIPVLQDINLEIRAGGFISFLGPSGCGKSTLLRLMAGLETATGGVIYVDGEAVQGPHYSRGLVFQDPNLFPWLTVEGNLVFGPRARGNELEKGILEYFLELTGLTEFRRAFPHQLSGGMAQRAALARALINRPVVLLLDEPLGALDAFTRMQMQDELYRIWRAQQITVVLVTHDIDEAIYLSERVVVFTPRPARIKSILDIPLSYPRSRENPDFFLLRNEILKLLNLSRPEEEGEFVYAI
ncbi:MAG: sulfonate transport system ATP-binding protein [Moorella sp. (in: firmicutes)]|uniref:Aliphatic sulfonates import ATP-binding protein SsuB n=1 Tax=Neomoorella thermoacetica TaxID=1525 RepID=A0A1J5PAP5_NEOTH|nr:sulfonate transport system ATP-binding protein [Moorella sp. (in: firmicutes)]OIQ60861.1 aliphatic sulfonates import ATP-binding protein SsuB [Moorella thermoacetica]